MIYQIEIPEELEAHIKAQGYDVDGYIVKFFIRPLLQDYKEDKKVKLLKKNSVLIDTEVEKVNKKFKVEKKTAELPVDNVKKLK